MNKKATYYIILILISIIFGTSLVWLFKQQKIEKTNYSELLVKKNLSNYHFLISGFKLVSDNYFQTLINNHKIINLVAESNESSSSKKNRLRDSLISIGNSKFDQYLIQSQLSINFILKNGESFARLRYPNKHSDNLLGVRYSIKQIQNTHESMQGFEQGRTTTGYRFIYPLLKSDEFVGSCEIIFNINSIQKKLNDLTNENYIYFLNKSLISNAIFNEYSSQYTSFKELPSFLIDKSTIQNSKFIPTISRFKKIIKKNNQSFKNALNSPTSEANTIYSENSYTDISFIQIPNIQGKHIGTLVKISNNTYFNKLKNTLYIQLGLIMASYILFLFLIILILKRETQIISTTKKLKASKEKLIEANNTKQMLIYTITHHLRNNFNAIGGFADLLIRYQDKVPEKVSKLMIGLNDSVVLSNSLMENLFIWAQIQMNNVIAEKKIFEASMWLKTQINSYNSLIKRKNITINNSTHYPIYINADQKLLNTIFKNMFQNAIRYSNKESIINIIIEDTPKSTIINISNSGDNFQQSDIEKIFSTKEWTGSDNNKGTGLGLILTKTLIELHGGNLLIGKNDKNQTSIKAEFIK